MLLNGKDLWYIHNINLEKRRKFISLKKKKSKIKTEKRLCTQIIYFFNFLFLNVFYKLYYIL